MAGWKEGRPEVEERTDCLRSELRPSVVFVAVVFFFFFCSPHTSAFIVKVKLNKQNRTEQIIWGGEHLQYGLLDDYSCI